MKWLKKVAATPLTTIARVVDNLNAQTNERTNAPSIRAVREAINNNIIELYPIGSIYMSVNNINPSTIFGGTWEQIKQKFLIAADDDSEYRGGTEGGAFSSSYTPSGTVGGHTLTIAEIPSHNHSIPSLSGTAVLGGGHTHTYYSPNFQQSNAGQGNLGSTSDETWKSNKTGNYDGTGANEGAHSHSVTTNASSTGNRGDGGSHNHDFSGSAATINTTPPYLAVYVWKRTA